MLPVLEKVSAYQDSCFAIKREVVPHMKYPWHYHPEYEIIFVEKSYGVRLMGDSIENFYDGDTVFIGTGLPHVWRNDEDFYQENPDKMVDVYVIHFKEDALGAGIFNLAETHHIKELFETSNRAMKFRGACRKQIAERIKAIYHANEFDRIVLLLQLLDYMAKSNNYRLLSSPGYSNSVNAIDSERIQKIYEYTLQNYSSNITLSEVASLVNLTKPSFCRYFKSRTFKSYTRFLNEVRIGKACKLLIQKELTVSQVCYETGYNNISHFNRQFKTITSCTAKEYIKQHTMNGQLIEA